MNQNTNSLKIVIIVILVLVVGYFIYTNYANRQADQSGRVITNTSNVNPAVAKQPDHVEACVGTWGPGGSNTFNGTWIVYTDGTHSTCVGRAISGNGGSAPAGTSTQ